ncbi:ParB N-terminal domain-containing protein [Saccharothrix hoggarensis]|uniref:ParB N-terminal domain-containing protein n=1 Tax=Saccharothrix hoggarensis TaxID=913853 RepID=A0ABW3QLQ9_9PSEU
MTTDRLTPTPPGEDPLSHIQWVATGRLDPNAWNPNRVHKAELRLLEKSLLVTGWIQPLLVNPDALIIDGFHRWRLAQDSKRVKERWGGRVPVAVLDLDRPQAMMQTIRINRAKGTHVAVSMSEIVRELIGEHGYDPQQIAAEIGATRDEVDLLAQDGVFAVKGIADWAYSPAWYPAENGKRVTT